MAMAKSVAASAWVPFIARIDDRSDRYLGGVTRSAARPTEQTSAQDPSGDEWFRALDAHRVMLGLLSWHVEVFSSMVCDDARWLQLALVGPARFMLTMRIPAAAQPIDVLDELGRWLRAPDQSQTIHNAVRF